MKSLESAVLRRIEADRGPLARLKRLSRAARFSLLVLLVAAEAALVWSLLRRADLATYPVGRMALTVGNCLLVLIASAWVALRPLYLPDRPLVRTALVA